MREFEKEKPFMVWVDEAQNVFNNSFVLNTEAHVPDSIPEALREMYQRGEIGTTQTVEIDEETITERSM